MEINVKLAHAIELWIDGKEERTVGMLARLADVSYPTARRAAQSEGCSSLESTIRIASVVFDKVELIEFAKKYLPELNNFFHASHEVAENVELLRFARSKNHLKILMLADCPKGTNETEISSKFGEDSLAYLDDLISANCLTSRDGNYFFEENIGSVSIDFAKELVGHFSELSSKDGIHQPGGATLYGGWGSFNQPTVKKLNSLATEYANTVSDIIKDENSKGDIVMFFGIVSDILKGREELT